MATRTKDLEEFLLVTAPETPPTLLHLMLRTGLPRAFIKAHIDYVESHAKKADFDADTFRRTSPAFLAWLADQPTISPLTWGERARLFLIEKWQTIGVMFG